MDPYTSCVRHLHYVFDAWDGDVLVQSYPCYLLRQTAVEALQGSDYSGFAIAPAEVSTSELFQELYGELELPDFAWLKVTGEPAEDDFGINEHGKLVVSERVFKLLQPGLVHCEVERLS